MLSAPEPVYIIERVIEYKPGKGYLVHWEGFGKGERSWQKPHDMPFVFKEEMARARGEYQSNLKTRKRSALASGITKPQLEVDAATILVAKRPRSTWTIDEVLGYSPTRGYFVSWVGCGAEHNSWQKMRDMPKGCRGEMKRARSKYSSAVIGPFSATQESVGSKQSNEGDRRSVVKQSRAPRVYSTKALDPIVKATIRKPSQVERSIKKLVQRAHREIHSVVAFDPAKGYLVHWRGEPECNDSWLEETQLGSEFSNQMRLASERYCDNLVTLRSL